MAPRPRKKLDPKSKDFSTRFALHLRNRLERRGLTTADFLQQLQAAGLQVSGEAIRKWLSGAHLPRPQDAETIGTVLRMRDYRHVWPAPP